MTAHQIAARIRAAARQLPLGATVRIRGSEPISAFNAAEWAARLVEDAACERDLVPRLTGERSPARSGWPRREPTP